jgi:hypothetical protein
MTRENELQWLLGICEAADDQDTGSLDAFREAFDVGTCAELIQELLDWRSASSDRECIIEDAQ